MQDIFIKQSEIKKSEPHQNYENQHINLSKKEILNSIPSNHLKGPDDVLAKNMIEWRWRFFKFPDKNNEVVEISYKFPDESRKFINNKGEWVEREISKDFDIFMVSEYYSYTEKK